MPSTVNTRNLNRRALTTFVMVLAGTVVLAGLAVLLLQRQNLRNKAQEELRTEIMLLGDLATDALLRSDYDEVDGLIHRWVDRHNYIQQITVTMPNGFVLANTQKTHVATEPILVQHRIQYAGRDLMTMEMIGDISYNESEFIRIIIYVSVATIGMVLLLGWLLWTTLQRTAIQPLEMQIRARQERERDLLHRTTELEAAVNELESFSYSVSHDLRGPLRAIDGYSSILIEDHAPHLDSNAQHSIKRIRDAVQRMGILIDELLELARLGRAEIRIRDVDMTRMANEIIDNCRQNDPNRKVQVTIAPGLIGRADERLLRLMLQNLLHNAWKYTCHTMAACIEFGRCQENTETCYFIRDNGAGFDMAFANKLFQPFQRLHSPDEFEGTGVGLAIVHRIIARHGGRVWAEAETAKGATFYFTLST